MFKRFSIYPSLGLILLTCAACQPNQTDTPNAPTPTTTQTKSSSSPQTAGPLPPPQTYDIQDNQGQVWAKLTQIAYTEDSIIATMAITNGSKEVAQLSAKDDMIICDDLETSYSSSCGNTYRLSAPPENPKISIQPGTTLKGQFVFIGRLAPQAKFLKLTTNSSSYSSYDSAPQIDFVDIPIKR